VTDQTKADNISATAFLNALMREWTGWSVLAPDAHGVASCREQFVVRFPLEQSGCDLLAPLAHRSTVGRHAFAFPLLEHRAGPAAEPIGFVHALTLLTREPAICGEATARQRMIFLRRVVDSAMNISDAVDRLPDGGAPDRALACRFIEAEQGLRYGHAVHPAPRSRDEFTPEDSRLFAPEHGNGFALRWWAVSPAALAHESACETAVPDIASSLMEADPGLAAELGDLPADRVLVPVHPWQSTRLRLEPRIERFFACGLAVDLGSAGAPWQATSSLRAIYGSHAPWMLKFSLNLRLTNSLRVIEPHECERGREVYRLLEGPLGQSLTQRYPAFHVMGEPAHLSLRDSDGRVVPETTVVFRENPFMGEDQPSAAVLAALCETGTDGRESLLSRLVRRIARGEYDSAGRVAERWFARFLEVAVEPLLVAQADYGLLFGAHQQNIVLGLDGGWPSVLYYRDCQGTGYVREHRADLERYLPDLDTAAGHVFPAAEAARLVGYYLVVNSVFGAIAALALPGLAAEERLVALFRDFLERLRGEGLKDTSAIDYLLSSPTLKAKGNFMIFFRNVNENTEVTDPLSAYVDLPNPLMEA